MVTTKIYQNTGKEVINVLGVGEIEPGEHVSITSEYHQPVILANYPTVIEVTDESATPEAPAEEEVE